MIFNAKDRPEKIFDFPIVKQIKYLGLLIDDKRNCFDSQKKRIDNNAHKYLSQMFSILGNCCNRMLIGKTFWKGLALTNLLYGADVINFTKTELDNLQIKDNKAYRIILKVTQSTAAEILRGEIGATSSRARDIKLKIENSIPKTLLIFRK